MCESKVAILKDGKEEIIMEDVVRIEVEGDTVKLFGLLGEMTEVKGKIKLMDMKNHKILLEG
ncbi:putative RNA-binding protein [Archaeoglobus sulfaticallidus PM70-1]|uniref:Putative RNA-binding protein n=1 Tax=Archaeoglobus sulfaticallidus PM70-1 TaxID=387631 RepID=N0BDB4_9EURY|nr:CooT family nickel-binding protein [Archaeoglobus sulfaticallidus]AGK61609.1 putative RNA-binding protein [Archaeoglobus sulfaticallidus PM70-1]